MKQDTPDEAYSLKVEEVFHLGDGTTVLVGSLQSGSPLFLAPSEVDMFIDDGHVGRISLVSERMPGPGSKGRRAVETKSPIHANDIRGHRCLLVRR